MPINKTCAEYGDRAAEYVLAMKVKEFETLDEQKALEHVDSIIGERLYESFQLLYSSSLVLSDKVLKLNFAKQIEVFCKKKTKETTLLGMLIEARQCVEEGLQNTSKKFLYSDHHLKFRTADEQNSQKLLEIQSQLQSALKIPIQNFTQDALGIVANLTPRDGTVLSHEVYQLSLDEKLVALSGKLNHFLMNLLIDSVKENKVKGKDIFQDIKRFFKGEGYSEKEASKLSFYFLGAYATRGASIYYAYNTLHPKPLAALWTLSMLISHLDKMAYKNGSNYALPYQLNSKCHLGKSYHFWLAAFQGAYLRAQGFNSQTSYYVPVISGIGYDITFKMNGRDITKLFQIKHPYDEYANGTRFDLWARSLGANFGIHQGRISKINADQVLINLFEKARMPSKQPVGMKETVFEYLNIVQPVPMILRLSL